VQAIGRQPQRAPDGAPVHCVRHRPEQATLYRLVQQHAGTFFAQAEDAADAGLPHLVEDGFDTFLECGTLARSFRHLCPLLTAQPKLLTPMLQAVHRVISRHLLGLAGLQSAAAGSGAVTLIQRFGSAVNLSIHLHCRVLDGVYRRSAAGALVFVKPAHRPTKRCSRCCTRSSPGR